jgi:hypothetical protein
MALKIARMYKHSDVITSLETLGIGESTKVSSLVPLPVRFSLGRLTLKFNPVIFVEQSLEARFDQSTSYFSLGTKNAKSNSFLK